ncbi:MAG TPA: type II secretion system protein [bacterium]|jgi:prepilin-type N-terminal cleavage/methylation domain-containing protein|nr:type II secretion system protein [bacterium]
MRTLRDGLRRLDQRGYSLVELMFVVGIAGIAIASIVRFSFTSRMNLSRQEVATDLYSTNARIGSNLRADLGSAQEILANYNGAAPGDDSALMAMVRTSAVAGGAPHPVAFTLPALVAPMNDPDLTGTAATTWGNELMYVASVAPITFTVQDVTAWGGCTCTATSFAAERVQFVYDYLTNQGTGNVPGLGPALRLVQWRSAPYIDYFQSLDPSQSGRSPIGLSETCATLLNYGYTTAFDTRQPQSISLAFYVILTASAATSTGVNTEYSYLVSPVTTLGTSSWAFMDEYDSLQAYKVRPNVNLGRVSSSGMFGSIASPYTKSMAYNNVGASSPMTSVLDSPGSLLQVPKYAQADLSVAGLGGGPGFPGGFEVAIMGPNGQRQVYMRRVLMASGGSKPGAKPRTFMAHEAADEVTVNNPY